MNKYQNGKIYKLVNTEGTLTYIGSTTQVLAKRKANHHSNYKNWKNGKYHFVSSYKIFDDDEDGCQIVLLEAFPCETKEELEKRERYFIENNECVNKVRPTRTKKEYYEDNKEKFSEIMKKYRDENKDKLSLSKKQYYENNKEKVQEIQKQYREKNTDKIRKYRKEYASDNKEKIREHHKEYRKENKDKLQQYLQQYHKENIDKIKQYRVDNKDKIQQYNKQYRESKKNVFAQQQNCICGGHYSIGNKTTHFKTLKHKDYMDSIKTQQDEIDKLEEEFNKI